MKRSTTLATTLGILLAVIAGSAGFWLGRGTSRGGAEIDRLAHLEKENVELRSMLDKLSRDSASEAGADRSPATNEPNQKAPLRRAPVQSVDVEMLLTLREGLTSANRSIEEWRTKSVQLQTELDQAREEQKRLAMIESSLNEQLAATRRVAEAKETELANRNERLVALEAANKRATTDAGAAEQKSKELLKASDELQEIYRRRESYLNSLLSRYKEVTEQYRAFASILENRRGPEGTPGANISIAGPELSRIQNTLTLAEEDLRQLNALNAQALRIQKKLPIK
jgi:chromosome segregation ATPase